MSLLNHSVSILTEHLGYAPIALIDELINTVNDILYKCTSAMEEFLRKRYGPDSHSRKKVTSQDIQVGTAKLETLLESIVDRCFDNFEIYALRNLLTIPEDLIREGYIRLKHHKGVDFETTSSSGANLDDEIDRLEAQLYFETELNSVLRQKNSQIAQELQAFQHLKSTYPFLTIPATSSKQLNDTLLFLSSQSTSMIPQIQQIQQTYESKVITGSAKSVPRDAYLEEFSRRAIESTGIQIISHFDKKTEEESVAAAKAASILREV